MMEVIRTPPRTQETKDYALGDDANDRYHPDSSPSSLQQCIRAHRISSSASAWPRRRAARPSQAVRALLLARLRRALFGLFELAVCDNLSKTHDTRSLYEMGFK